MRLVDRRAKPGEGKTAQRLIEMLAAQGYVVTLLMPALGFWRSAHADVHKWEAYAVDDRAHLEVSANERKLP